MTDGRPSAAPATPPALAPSGPQPLTEWMFRVDELAVQGGADRPVPLGFQPLDAHLGQGLWPGDLALLAGRQGAGKTAFALQVARNVALAGQPVTYVSFEHGPDQLVERLAVLEANLVAGDAAPTLAEARSRLARGDLPLEAALGDLPGVLPGLARMRSYGERLRLTGARGDTTSVAVLADALAGHDGPGLLVVDYLQKVHQRGAVDEDVRVAQIATALKDLAVQSGQVVLAVSALERAGLDAARVRARHLKGSATLAYEADVILVLQDKYDVVARDRLMFDVAGAASHHQWAVLSVEKNRHGEDGVDIALRKRLARGHYDPVGHLEADALVDERLDPTS